MPINVVLAELTALLTHQRISRQSYDAILEAFGQLGGPPAARGEATSLLPPRYVDQGCLGVGGMGEVRRVYDTLLHRTVALKVVHPDIQADPRSVARFVDEAQTAAQLQHPGIVPVHDLGRLADGRWFFTMKEVAGRTLKQVLDDHHRSPGEGAGPPAVITAGLRRLMETFARVCEAVAYAHSRGVIHRDLKPSNVMIGAHGEVLVVDWGLARARPSEGEGEVSVTTLRSQIDGLASLAGWVGGTPAYMAPEQARGEPGWIGPHSDVYALGAMLFHILTGRPPRSGAGPTELLRQARQDLPLAAADAMAGGHGPTISGEGPAQLAHLPPRAVDGIPPELDRLCRWAMSPDLHRRPPNAGVLAEAVQHWLDGADRREVALARLADASQLQIECRSLREEASNLRAQAKEALGGVGEIEEVERKLPGWELEDRGEVLERAAHLKEVAYLQKLQEALSHDPELPEAHQRLAEHYQRTHADAEARRDHAQAAGLELLLREHDREGQFADYLKGDGWLTLITDPPQARVEFLRYVRRRRVLVEEPVGYVAATPMLRKRVPAGSYLLRIQAPGRREVLYPVLIERGRHHDGLPPGEEAPRPVYLPLELELGPDEVYIPAGWFWSGDVSGDRQSLPWRKIWIDALVVTRFAVTHREYLSFVEEMDRQDRLAEVSPHIPTLAPSQHQGLEGQPLYERVERGRWRLRPDLDGDHWDPDEPVGRVDWYGAVAWCRWKAEATGRPWRLLTELEWEKSARGVDGRAYPWGDFIDPTFAYTLEATRGKVWPCRVDSYPIDQSPWGVRGMAGNTRDWCLDVWRQEGPAVGPDGRFLVGLEVGAAPLRPTRGGMYAASIRHSRVSLRTGAVPFVRDSNLGFRAAYSLAWSGE